MNYTVVQGDHISRIAEKFHFFDSSIIWDHPNNAAVKAKRPNPHVLFPGDVIFIPDKTVKEETRATTSVHKFRVDRQRLVLRLWVEAMRDDPPKDPELKLKVEGVENTAKQTGKTIYIERSDTNGRLALAVLNVNVPILIGYLDPVEEVTGQQARLNNLGYEAGTVGTMDEERFRSAVEEFQCDFALKVTGDCDADTRAMLQKVNGC
jgi:hypothetical protein